MGAYRYRWTSFVREIFFLALGAAFLVPVAYIVMVALKSPEEASIEAVGLPKDATFESFSTAWNEAGSGGLGDSLLTSTIITVLAVSILLLVSLPCAYVLVRRPGKVTAALTVMFLIGIILPYQLGILPLYSAMNSAGLVGTRFGVALVYVGQLTPFTVFLLTGFMRKLPPDYEEAAQLDGAGSVRTLLWIVVPLLRTGIATVVILDGLLVWNDFFVPLVWLNGAEHIPVPVAIFSFVGQFTSQWSLVFAGILIAVIPILVLYMLIQRYLIQGFASGVRG